MLYQLSDVLTIEGKRESVSVLLELESLDTVMGHYPLLEKPSFQMDFTYIEKGKAKASGDVKLVFGATCDRCLADTKVELDLVIDRVLTTDGEDGEEGSEDLYFLNGTVLDIEAFMYNEIIVNWPVKILCKDECKGVCPVCGQNLNEKECGCDTFVPDPRMAVIKDIFRADKEV